METDALEDLIVGRVEPHIYAFTTNTVPNCLKVGDTYRPVDVRLDEWRAFYPSLRREYEESACVSDDIFFRDFSVHDYLENTRHFPRLMAGELKPGIYFSKEFFRGARKTDVAEAIADIRRDFETSGQRYQFYKAVDKLPTGQKYPSSGIWELRPNQEATVKKFEAALSKGRKNLLMYAVMRFGKSFTSMCCAKTMNGGKGAKLVVVVSAKADVRDEWRRTVESAENFRNDYEFFSSDDLVRNPKVITDHLHKKRKRAVVFLTLQDLKDAAIKRKHRYLFKEKVDLLIVDETHYGARADSYGRILRATKDKPSRRDLEDADTESETKEAVKAFNVKVTLHLSGTPYRILMGSEFGPDDIIAFYSFTDIAEAQKGWDAKNAKKPEEEQEEEWANPYYGFPQMIRFAFNPNASTRARLEALKKGGATYAFSALFEPKSVAKDEGGDYCRFKYEQEVLDLFQIIDGSKKDDELLGFLDYPKLKEGKMCRHIVCVLPYCASCDALAALLKRKGAIFKNLGDYEIVNVSGHDMPREYGDVEDVKRAIRDFEKAGKKTLTLTVNRMLTGSTVPEWDTMLYFKDTASAQEYDQATFRLQNQYVQEMTSTGPDGMTSVVKYNKKPQTLLVDFDPERLFRMQEAKAKFYNVNDDKGGNAKLEERIRKEIAFSPIVTLNAGRLRQAEATDIMAAVSAYSRKRGVSDEVRDVGVDISALNRDPALLKAINDENPLDDKNGFTISAHDGDEDELDVPDDLKKIVENADENHDPSGKNSATTSAEEKARKLLEGKLRAYYSRLLFFAFLTKDKVQSVEDIVKVMSKGENARIARNVGIEKPVLKAILKHFDKFILSDLDYKIRNLDTLSFDAAVDPVERATTALRKFDRLGPSEIMTPEKITDEMVALLPEDELRRIARDGEKILDISGKAGEFAIALYKRYRAIDPKIDVSDLILTIPTSGHAYEFTRKVYEALELNADNIAAQFTAYDLLEVKDGEMGAIDYAHIKNLLTQKKPFCEITMKDKVLNRGKRNTIAAVVGNPPYQQMTGGDANGSDPIYNIFIDVSMSLCDKGMLIHPGRFLFRAGKTPKDWNEKILNDAHFNVAKYFSDSSDVFPSVDLKGGVAISHWDVTKSIGPIGLFVTHKQLKSILEKVKRCSFESFANLVCARTVYRLDEKLYEENPWAEGRQSKGHRLDMGSNLFSLFPELFTEKASVDGDAKVYGLIKGKRVYRYVKKSYIVPPDNFDFYKVMIPAANGSGTLGETLSTPVVEGPSVGHTETFLSIGKFKRVNEANACLKYIKSKFARTLLSTLKITQHNIRETWSNVPLQDFSKNSSINWTKSIAEIDQQLYEQYKLTPEEQSFIESMIKPME